MSKKKPAMKEGDLKCRKKKKCALRVPGEGENFREKNRVPHTGGGTFGLN